MEKNIKKAFLAVLLGIGALGYIGHKYKQKQDVKKIVQLLAESHEADYKYELNGSNENYMERVKKGRQ